MPEQTVPQDIDGHAEELGTELVPAPAAPPTNLFRTDDPVEVVKRASEVADALKGVLVKQHLTTTIQGREHVRVEGWTTLGSMLGVVPVVEWTRPVEKGWEARVVARTLDGRTIGAAEAQCTRDESTWKSRDDYALRSMAQTRATSKALRGPLGFIVTLAGFDATPLEEMPREQNQPRQTRRSNGSKLTKRMQGQLTDALSAYIEAKLPPDRLELKLVAAGVEDTSDVEAAIAGLDREKGKALYEWLAAETEAAPA